MKQGHTIASPIPGGAITITECSNTDTVKLPTLTIMLAAVPAFFDEPARPSESLSLTHHQQVDALFASLAAYYDGGTRPPATRAALETALRAIVENSFHGFSTGYQHVEPRLIEEARGLLDSANDHPTI